MLWWFLPYINSNQSYSYIYTPSFWSLPPLILFSNLCLVILKIHMYCQAETSPCFLWCSWSLFILGEKRICYSTYETNKDTAHAYIFLVQIPENKKYHIYFQQHLALPPISCGLGSVIWCSEKEMATHSSILAWKNHMDRRAWWATVHEVAKIRVSTCQGIWY